MDRWLTIYNKQIRKIKMKYLTNLIPYLIYIIISLFINLIILKKTINDIDWIIYLIFIVTSFITKSIIKKFKNNKY